jgi:hypothetical protein
MPIAFGRDLGTGQINTSGTTVVITTIATADVGEWIIVRVATDNLSATTPTFTCADSAGNTYAVDIEGARSASAGAGIAGAVFSAPVTSQLASGQTITVTLSGATFAKAAVAQAFTGVGGRRASGTNSANGLSTAPSATLTTPVSGDLVIGHIAHESRTAPSAYDTDTTDGSWSTGAVHPSAGTGTDNQRTQVIYQHKIVTGTGSQTYDATVVSADWIDFLSAYTPLVPTEGSGTGAIAWVGSATGTTVRSGAGSGAIDWVGSATGVSTHSGAATGAITWVGVASGVAAYQGSGTGAITWAGTATGTTIRSGAGTGAIDWVGSATGTNVHSGSASGTISWAGTATGSRVSSGSASGSIDWAGSATGEMPTTGDTVDLHTTGDGTNADVVNEADTTTDLWASIDDDPSSPNDADWNNNTDDAGQAFYLLTDMPGDFDTAVSATITLRYRGQAFGTGTVTLYARLYRSDETTALSDEVEVAQVTADTSFTNTSAVDLTGIVAGDETIWDGARLRLRWEQT